jgi:hypothetical protein
MSKSAYTTKSLKTKDKDAKSETDVMYRTETVTPGDPIMRRRGDYKKGAKAPVQLDFFSMMMR